MFINIQNDEQVHFNMLNRPLTASYYLSLGIRYHYFQTFTRNLIVPRSGILSAQSETVRVLVSNYSHFSVMYKEQKFSLC